MNTIVKCMTIPDVSVLPEQAIAARIAELDGWPASYADALNRDPRCGCEAPDSTCEWDSPSALENYL